MLFVEATWLLLEWPARFRMSDGEYAIDVRTVTSVKVK